MDLRRYNALILREDFTVDVFAGATLPPLIPLSFASLPSFFANTHIGISHGNVEYYATEHAADCGANAFTFLDYAEFPVVDGPIYALITCDDAQFTQRHAVRAHFEKIAAALQFTRQHPESQKGEMPSLNGYGLCVDINLVQAEKKGTIELVTGRLLVSKQDEAVLNKFIGSMHQIGLLDKDLIKWMAQLLAFLMSRNASATEDALETFFVLNKRVIPKTLKTRLKLFLQLAMSAPLSAHPPMFVKSISDHTCRSTIFFSHQPSVIKSAGALTINC